MSQAQVELLLTAKNNLSKVLNQIKKESDDTFKKGADGAKKMNKEISGLDKAGRGLRSSFGMLATVGGLFGVGMGANAIIQNTAALQDFRSQLTTMYGDIAKGDAAFAVLQETAAKTPFTLEEITRSFIKMKNLGLDVTSKDLIKMSDIASSVGQGFDQLGEAIADASVNEFERLKQFGIKASKSGDNVTFMFKGQSKTVKATAKNIKDYILSLGDLQGISGASAGRMKTLSGVISNLQDNFFKLTSSIGDKASPILTKFLTGTSNLMARLAGNDAVKSLERQRSKVLELVAQIQSENTSYETKKGLMKELNSIYPGFIKNMDDESSINSQLADGLVRYNEELINKIMLANLEAEEVKKVQKAADMKQKIWEWELKVREGILNDVERMNNAADKSAAEAAAKIAFTKANGEDMLKTYEEEFKKSTGRRTPGLGIQAVKNDMAAFTLTSSIDEYRKDIKDAEDIAKKQSEKVSNFRKQFGLTSSSADEIPGSSESSGGATAGSTETAVKSGLAKTLIVNINKELLSDIVINVADMNQVPKEFEKLLTDSLSKTLVGLGSYSK